MSIILVLFLLIGVAYSKHISFYNNTNGNVPIISRQHEQRICAELCMSGLGGEPCGATCLDIIPEGMLQRSLQSSSELKNASNTDVNLNNVNQTTIKTVIKSPLRIRTTRRVTRARRDACPILCKNQLGYPLCGCNTTELVLNKKSFYQVDYFEICSYFCVVYNYKIFGCPDCEILKTAFKVEQLLMQKQKIQIEDADQFDWNAWCGQQCHEGEGGAACNCDLLPMLSRRQQNE